jgi:hypothetical protein
VSVAAKMARVDESEQVHRRQVGLHGIDWRIRVALVSVGGASWAAGGAASFLSSNGAGAASLVVAGIASGILGLVGRWPSRVSMSGNELLWEDVRETVDSQIEVVKASGETQNVIAELSSLRQRLDMLQRTGSVPTHPAQVYDEAVEAAIRRLMPEVDIVRQDSRSRDRADFTVWYRTQQLYVETKWRSDPGRDFQGSTLPRLLATLPNDAKLLVVVNTVRPPSSDAIQIVKTAMGLRGRIVAWRDTSDDMQLGQALASLFEIGQ